MKNYNIKKFKEFDDKRIPDFLPHISLNRPQNKRKNKQKDSLNSKIRLEQASKPYLSTD